MCLKFDETFIHISKIVEYKKGTKWLKNKRLNSAEESLRSKYRTPEAKPSVTLGMPNPLHEQHGCSIQLSCF